MNFFILAFWVIPLLFVLGEPNNSIQYEDCPSEIRYNKYNILAKVLFLSDSNGLQFNKLLDKNEKKFAIHGIWPKDRCLNGKRLQVDKLTENEIILIKYKLSQLNFPAYDFTGEFLLGEYKRHWHANGYTVEEMIRSYQDFIVELEIGINGFAPHSCVYDESSGFNRLQQIVKLEGVPASMNLWSSCKIMRKFKFENLEFDVGEALAGKINLNLNKINTEKLYKNLFDNYGFGNNSVGFVNNVLGPVTLVKKVVSDVKQEFNLLKTGEIGKIIGCVTSYLVYIISSIFYSIKYNNKIRYVKNNGKLFRLLTFLVILGFVNFGCYISKMSYKEVNYFWVIFCLCTNEFWNIFRDGKKKMLKSILKIVGTLIGAFLVFLTYNEVNEKTISLVLLLFLFIKKISHRVSKYEMTTNKFGIALLNLSIMVCNFSILKFVYKVDIFEIDTFTTVISIFYICELFYDTLLTTKDLKISELFFLIVFLVKNYIMCGSHLVEIYERVLYTDMKVTLLNGFLIILGLVTLLLIKNWSRYITLFGMVNEVLVIWPLVKYSLIMRNFDFVRVMSHLVKETILDGYEWHLVFGFLTCIIIPYLNFRLMSSPIGYFVDRDSLYKKSAWKNSFKTVLMTAVELVFGLLILFFLMQYISPLEIVGEVKAKINVFLMIGFLAHIGIILFYRVNDFFMLLKIVTVQHRFTKYYMVLFSSFSVLLYTFFLSYSIVLFWVNLPILNLFSHTILRLIPGLVGFGFLSLASSFLMPIFESFRHILLKTENPSIVKTSEILIPIKNLIQALVTLMRYTVMIGSVGSILYQIAKEMVSSDTQNWYSVVKNLSHIPLYIFLLILVIDMCTKFLDNTIVMMLNKVNFRKITKLQRNGRNYDVVRNNGLIPDYIDQNLLQRMSQFNPIEVVSGTKRNISAVTQDVNNGHNISYRRDNRGQEVVIPGMLGGFRGLINQISRTASHITHGRKESEMNEIQNSYLLPNANLFEELGLVCLTSWQEVETLYTFADESINTDAYYMTSDEYENKKNQFKNQSVYFPHLNTLDSHIKNCLGSIHAQILGAGNLHNLKLIADGLKDTKSLKEVYSDEYITNSEVWVVSEVNNYMEVVGQTSISLVPYISLFLRSIGLFDISKYLPSTLELTSGNDIVLTHLVKKDILDDNIMNLEDYCQHTKYSFERIWQLVADKSVYLVSSHNGKAFICKTAEECVSLMKVKTGNDKGQVINKFFNMVANKCDFGVNIRPFIMNSFFTFSTLTPAVNTFGLKIKKGQLILSNQNEQFYITSPLALERELSANSNEILSKDKVMRSVLCLSTGLIYHAPAEKKQSVHLGSGSIVRFEGGLYVVTNRHVVHMPCNFELPTTEQNIGLKCKEYTRDLTYVTSFGKKFVKFEMNNLVNMGDDFAIFKLSSFDEFEVKKLLKPVVDVGKDFHPFAEFGSMQNQEKESFYLNTVRQEVTVKSVTHNKVHLRPVIVKFNNYLNLYDILGYSTGGYSGSPIFSISESGLKLCGVVSAMEAINNARVHMTRIVDVGIIKENVRNFNDDIVAILDCFTEKIRAQLSPAPLDYLWCSILDDEQVEGVWSVNEDPKFFFDYIECSDKERVLLKKYWMWYLDNFGGNEAKENNLSELVECSTFEEQMYPESVSDVIVKKDEYFGSLLQTLKRSQEDSFSIIFRDQPGVDHIFEPVENGFWKYLIKIGNKYSNRLFVDFYSMIEILKNAGYSFDLGNHIDELLAIGGCDRVLIAHEFGDSLNFVLCSKAGEEIIEADEVMNNLLTVHVDSGDRINFGFCNNETPLEAVKRISQQMLEIRNNKQLLTEKIQKLKNKLTDAKQSDEYLMKKKKWEEILREYNEQKENFKEDKNEVERIKKIYSDKIMEVEAEYIEKIKSKRLKRDQYQHEIKDSQDKAKEKWSRMEKNFDERINVLIEKKRKISEDIQKLHNEKKNLRKSVLHNKIVENLNKQIQSIGDEIKSLQAEKNEKTKKLREEKIKSMPLTPIKPDKKLNPDQDEDILKLNDEISALRAELRKSLESEENLKKELDTMKCTNVQLQKNFETIIKNFDDLKEWSLNEYHDFVGVILRQIENINDKIIQDTRRKPKAGRTEKDKENQKERKQYKQKSDSEDSDQDVKHFREKARRKPKGEKVEKDKDNKKERRQERQKSDSEDSDQNVKHFKEKTQVGGKVYGKTFTSEELKSEDKKIGEKVEQKKIEIDVNKLSSEEIIRHGEARAVLLALKNNKMYLDSFVLRRVIRGKWNLLKTLEIKKEIVITAGETLIIDGKKTNCELQFYINDKSDLLKMLDILDFLYSDWKDKEGRNYKPDFRFRRELENELGHPKIRGPGVESFGKETEVHRLTVESKKGEKFRVKLAVIDDDDEKSIDQQIDKFREEKKMWVVHFSKNQIGGNWKKIVEWMYKDEKSMHKNLLKNKSIDELSYAFVMSLKVKDEFLEIFEDEVFFCYGWMWEKRIK